MHLIYKSRREAANIYYLLEINSIYNVVRIFQEAALKIIFREFLALKVYFTFRLEAFQPTPFRMIILIFVGQPILT